MLNGKIRATLSLLEEETVQRFKVQGFMLKDEHRTSNVQHRMKNEYPIPNIQWLFLFLFSRFDTRNENLN